MKVLVLGGTGAMGIHLVQLLSGDGVETYVTSRNKRESVGNIHYIQGNAQNIEFIQTVLKEHWDAIVDFMAYSTSAFKERIDLLLKATSQYVFLSSARVYADSVSPITEASPRLLDVSQDKDFLSTDEYSLTKARQEDILRNTGKSNWTIIRPYITYSENRLQLGVLEKEEWLYRALQGRTIVFSEDINSKETTITYGLDVAKSIISIIGNSKAFGETFHITSKESITWNETLYIYLNVLEKYLGYKPKVLLLKDLKQFIDIHPAEYQILYDRLFNRIFNNDKLSRYFKIEEFVEAECGLRKCLEIFLSKKQFNNINWQFEAKKDRLTNEYTPLKEIKGIKQKIKYLFYIYK
jgi:nucleoside-diphosphate-sugar epimerase